MHKCLNDESYSTDLIYKRIKHAFLKQTLLEMVIIKYSLEMLKVWYWKLSLAWGLCKCVYTVYKLQDSCICGIGVLLSVS